MLDGKLIVVNTLGMTALVWPLVVERRVQQPIAEGLHYMRLGNCSARAALRTLFGLACAAALVSTVPARAQEAGGKSETKTKVTIKDGKNVKVTGCVTRAETGALMLTSVADKKGALPNYILVMDDDKERDLEKYVGQQLQVEGKAANQGDGKVKFETEEKTKGTSGDERKTERSAEMSGDLKLPFLGVKSYKMIAGACPGQ